MTDQRKARRRFISAKSQAAQEAASGIRELTGANEKFGAYYYASPLLSDYQRRRLMLLYQERDLWMHETGWFGNIPSATN